MRQSGVIHLTLGSYKDEGLGMMVKSSLKVMTLSRQGSQYL